MTWLPWGCLTWWVTSPVRWDGEEGFYNDRPLLEESRYHLQPLWTQQLEQLKGQNKIQWQQTKTTDRWRKYVTHACKHKKWHNHTQTHTPYGPQDPQTHYSCQFWAPVNYHLPGGEYTLPLSLPNTATWHLSSNRKKKPNKSFAKWQHVSKNIVETWLHTLISTIVQMKQKW